MTQVVSVLTIATIFTGLSIQIARFHSQSMGGGGGVYLRKTKIPMQELWLKMGGGLCARRGIWAGFYGTISKLIWQDLSQVALDHNGSSIYFHW